ncbi:ANTAR domain-containing protein [Streptomyces tubbatahanensis]|uniref:ANTAR domain-containing protein n=1 Tax=Streptomyces tubbatahanensis TaxID=2923272 RepID=A0ABY3XV25_9ACTN|nr:ANTAR domain-containing protein [Streptomyces tubbatahanensis]UNS98195.1 ANTAR domain-containing protein [Streptomyces tubbatahanensis]
MDRARRRARATTPSRAEAVAFHPPGTRHGVDGGTGRNGEYTNGEYANGEFAEAPNAPERQREQLCEQVEELRTEVEQLRQAAESRPVIDQARGMVMALAPCDAQTAWWVLVQVSQRSNVKLRRVARALVAGAEGTPVPEPVRGALAAALHRVRTDSR